MNAEQFERQISSYGAVVYFSHPAAKDFKSFSQGKKNQVLMLILKQAKKGANFKPEGNGNRLRSPLHQFAKIKSKAIALRVVYRPVQRNGLTEMQILAIGPRNKDEVYQLAQKRITDFLEEMDAKHN